jgi:hypothetical protein
MKWEIVNISDKISYLKELVINSDSDKFDDSDINIIDALITGSQNKFSGDVGFTIKTHHIEYMRNCWNTAIESQINNSVVDKIKKEINKF